MPSTTPCRSYPYPLDGDPIDVAGDIHDLAAAIDADVCSLAEATLPAGGGTGQVLTKVNGADFNVHWADPTGGGGGGGGDDDDDVWNSAWGVIGLSVLNATSGAAGSSLTTVPGIAVTVTTTAGRRYRVAAIGQLTKAGASTGNVRMQLLRDGVSLFNTPATGQLPTMMGALANGNVTIPSEVFVNGDGVSHLFQVQIAADVDNVTMAGGSLLYVEDVGPSAGFVPTQQPDPITQWNSAWGVVAIVKPIATTPSSPLTIAAGPTAPVPIPGATLPFTPVPGRRYRVRFQARAFGPTTAGQQAGGVLILFRNAVNLAEADWSSSGVQYGQASSELILTAEAMTAGAPASWSWQFQNFNAAVTIHIDAQSFFSIEDVGPTVLVSPEPPNLTTTPWVDLTSILTLQNSWVEYATTHRPKIRKIGDIVYLRGAIKSGTAFTIGTLPAAFRPVDSGFGFVVPASPGSPSTNVGQLNIGSDGLMSAQFMTFPATYLYLNSSWSTT